MGTDKEQPNVYGQDRGDFPYVECWLCNTAYISMLKLSIDHAGIIFVCKGCHKHLKEALDAWEWGK